MLWGDPLWELAGPSHSGCRVTGRGLPYGDMVWGVRTRSVVVGGPVSLSVVGRECRLPWTAVEIHGVSGRIRH